MIAHMAEMPKPKRVIVNADDFGFSRGISAGILRAHRDGIVTSTTVVANMPAAADDVRLLAQASELGVGVHLNVSQGPPLSPEGRRLADADGQMRRSAAGVILACLRRPGLLSAVEAEFDAQIRWLLDHGIQPTHLDSHRHAHGFPPIFARVAKLARRYHIRFVRRMREALPGRGWPAAPAGQRRVGRLLSLLDPMVAAAGADLLATRGTWGVAHTGGIGAGWLMRAAAAVGDGTVEILTHPGLATKADAAFTRLVQSRQRELEALCSPAVREAFQASNIELTHYGRL